MGVECKHVKFPVLDVSDLLMGDKVIFSGRVICGRDAVLPKVCELITSGSVNELDVNFEGAAILHTAVSGAGIGPTSSNKLEIEESFGPLCDVGVRVFLGKGALLDTTIVKLEESDAVYAVVPPVTALLGKNVKSKRLIAFSQLGMEALYEIELEECPAVIAVAHGKSIYQG